MRREKLIEVAFVKFSEMGYNVTLSDIANSAGIKKQSIYNHFEKKDDLLYETIKLELLNFYTTKSSEFDDYMLLEGKDALKAMFFSICDYYRDIKKLKFLRWILLMESNDFFERCRELIRQNEGIFYTRVYKILSREILTNVKTEQEVWSSVQTFVVMVHGVLDGMLLYQDVYEPQILIENTWNFYWMSIENLANKK